MAAESPAFAGWLDVTEAGQMPTSSPGVSVAWRVYQKGRPGAEITLNKMVLEEIGWTTGTNVLRILVAPDRLSLALVPALVGKKLAVRARSGSIVHRLDWVTLEETRRAERVPHRIEAGALVITLPDWAAPPQAEWRAIPLTPHRQTPAAPAPKPVVSAVPPPARQPARVTDDKPPTAEELVEAAEMVRNGSGALQLAQYFVWPLPVAQRVAREAREKAA